LVLLTHSSFSYVMSAFAFKWLTEKLPLLKALWTSE